MAEETLEGAPRAAKVCGIIAFDIKRVAVAVTNKIIVICNAVVISGAVVFVFQAIDIDKLLKPVQIIITDSQLLIGVIFGIADA